MFACKAKKEASKGLMDTFVKMIRGYEEPSKAAQHMKAALTSAGIQTLPYQSEPFQTFADIVTEHDTLKNMTEGPFQSERVKVAKALKTKSIQFQSMVADTHPSRMFLAECGACSDLIKNAVDFLTSAVKDVDEVREKSVAEVIEKTQAAYKKMHAWCRTFRRRRQSSSSLQRPTWQKVGLSLRSLKSASRSARKLAQSGSARQL